MIFHQLLSFIPKKMKQKYIIFRNWQMFQRKQTVQENEKTTPVDRGKKNAFQKEELLSHQINRQQHQFNPLTDAITDQCVQKARKAFSLGLKCRKITQNVFKEKFGFQRAQTSSKIISNLKDFNKKFRKKYEQRVLRDFIILNKWQIKKRRNIMRNEMSLKELQTKILKTKNSKNSITDKEISSTLQQMKNLQPFLKPLVSDRIQNMNNQDLEAKKKQIIVEIQIVLKIQNILKKELDERQFVEVANMNKNLIEKKISYSENFGNFLQPRQRPFWEVFESENEQIPNFIKLDQSPSEESIQVELFQSPNFGTLFANLSEQQ